jgi:phosphoribosylformylglycinamidine synthase
MTGVLGVNRDAMGTGIGGARLLFNTNVLCFGTPSYNKPLLKGQKHPLYIREGVVRGVRDAGNQSGVPTVNGAVIYDDRYSGKPLVFCGTGAVLPNRYDAKNSWGKYVDAGDKILMVGGRVGKDGIHGATASSTHSDESTPATIVQIGSPLTQKLLSDFLECVARKGLVKSSTDNGAGGLSSSIGELAELAGGATVQLKAVPLKYPGLAPWEIFVSESQERMTLVCEDRHCETLIALAKTFEVEATVIGEFTNTGLLEVYYEQDPVACLDLEFLHQGVPRKVLQAEWERPKLEEPTLPVFDSYNEIFLQLLASDNICSRREIIRQYDHEVKGRTVLKPLMGKQQNAPQDAAVLRLNFKDYKGIAVSNGIIPRYGDIDPYEMSAGSFDEAVRQIIAVGGRLPDLEDEHPIFWSVNDNFCVPNIVYDPIHNPDGKDKLAKLVLMCDALYDMSTYFHIPMTSGKDSMKNDFGTGQDKISVPPTILYSMVSGIEDVRNTLSSEWKEAGDLIYQVGATYDELGASEFYKSLGFLGAHVPRVRPEDAKRVYKKFSKAHELGLLKSAHDLSDGGLIVAIGESCIGSKKGARIELGNGEILSMHALLFSESHSRFVVSISIENQSVFEQLMSSDAQRIGEVSEEAILSCSYKGRTLVSCSVEQMNKAWERNFA